MSGEEFFASKGWTPFAFQRLAWQAYREGRSGLIHSSTGTGKTYAAFLGPAAEADDTPGSKVLWLTPLRALSNDTAVTLEAAVTAMGLTWDVGVRTGDTTASQRAKQKKRLPIVLVTTPESLALFLTQPDARDRFSSLQCVIVDEWHELLGSKRGVLTELNLARLRKFQPHLRIWGLSATLGNLDVAMTTLLGTAQNGSVIRGETTKLTVIDAILPPRMERFPWAGHLGLTLLPQVVMAIDEGRTALVFTNTRSQTEIWYQAILKARPDWAGQMALHHGSLDRGSRDWVEDQLRLGTLRCVVCTSSLDLGVDFTPVDRVLQIGSPKGVARLLQRGGRSGHQPGAISRVTCVPTNALELIEIAAARSAAEAGQIESRDPYLKPLDVLAQHAVSMALAGGFTGDELFAEVRTTHAYRDLTEVEWDWVLDFITRGGPALTAYPDYRRVERHDGRYVVSDSRIARRHRQSLGTITSDASIQVRFVRGGRLGTVEESFAAKLKRGDRFTFAGRVLEFVRLHEMTLQVKLSKKKATTVPRGMGGRMPLSSELAAAVRAKLNDARFGHFNDPEMNAVHSLLAVQAEWSHIPAPDQLLIERLQTRQGFHVFVYPFEGRLVHEGLAALLAYRLSRRQSQTFTFSVNDYGLEILSPDTIDVDAVKSSLTPVDLIADVMESLNAAELAKRQFREVARISGLISPGLPHAGRSAKQLQASSGLFYNVFQEYDPGNLLLWQARQEVLDRQFELTRLHQALLRLNASTVIVVDPPRPTPLAFPLLVSRLRESLSSESLAERVRKMVSDLERQAGPA
ncbi:ligase-associated DNA damage response DEXH box helicase [soil metagenome]